MSTRSRRNRNQQIVAMVLQNELAEQVKINRISWKELHEIAKTYLEDSHQDAPCRKQSIRLAILNMHKLGDREVRFVMDQTGHFFIDLRHPDCSEEEMMRAGQRRMHLIAYDQSNIEIDAMIWASAHGKGATYGGHVMSTMKLNVLAESLGRKVS